MDASNNSKYGPQAGVFSSDQNNINLAVDQPEYGGAVINEAPIFRVDNMPDGGMMESGFGREGVRYAMGRDEGGKARRAGSVTGKAASENAEIARTIVSLAKVSPKYYIQLFAY